MRRALVLLFLIILIVALIAHFVMQEQAAEYLGDIAFFVLIGAAVIDTIALGIRVVLKLAVQKSKSTLTTLRNLAFLRRSLDADRAQ